jgi:hypothetical protein
MQPLARTGLIMSSRSNRSTDTRVVEALPRGALRIAPLGPPQAERPCVATVRWRNSRIVSAISRECVSSAKCPVL